MSKKHSAGHGHKHGKGMPHMAEGKSGLGSNLKLPKPSQAMTVMQKKDTMAHNVGGSSAHMEVDAKSNGHQDLIESGGGKLGHKNEKY